MNRYIRVLLYRICQYILALVLTSLLVTEYKLWFLLKGGYLLGGSIAGIFTSVMKLNIVSPRPNFMSICFPGETVQDYSFCSSDNYWNPTKVCDNKDEKELSEGLKSFPSYHATIATYG